jgi:alkanesulfonate monooxygenase SsuD/methylene tetrahydromethanopterin reductase-like flavin-dependent oxidoreductase (luciferase family)
VKFGAAFGVSRTDWANLRAACLAAERSGWNSVWIEDHLLADEGDWRDAKLESWTTLAAIAALTSRVRIGQLVGANTFRNPGLTAKLATTLDHLSGGRAVLGLGAGWFAREHEAFGINFRAGVGERLDQLDESAMLVRRLLDGETVTHAGRFYEFKEAVCAPRPIQNRLPILIGGSGPRKTLPIVAAYADIWNAIGDPRGLVESLSLLRNHCLAIGRNVDKIAVTINQICVVRDDPEVALQVEAGIAQTHGLLKNRSGVTGLSAWGPPRAIAKSLRPYVELGVDEVIFIFRSPFDFETIDRIGEIQTALENSA